ncbi:MAG: transporter substrate-binding domain-containing protein [Myxococcota bacterium]|nr:transporter substrate-binding domain-containing protein [Myxococcota bacterium]
MGRAARCALLALLSVACATPRPVLRVGTSGDYAPFSVDGRGFDVEVAEHLAADLGRELEWVSFRWPELRAQVEAGAFDVAMSGVTWRPERAVSGLLTRAVAAGGPCVLGAPDPARVGVNRGGALERWARAHFDVSRIATVDDNRSLPGRLERGEFDAIVTDSFELPHFRRAGVPARCEPPADRKVYWIAPRRVAELSAPIDAWLVEHEGWLDERRAAWLGGSAPRTEVDHLLDLLARRLGLMPAVARWKHERGLPIEDRARERRVREAARGRAATGGLDPVSVEGLFGLQIELAKRIQQEPPRRAPRLDLGHELRPALGHLGDRIVASLARLAPLVPSQLDAADWAPLHAWLDASEHARLRAALLAVRPAPSR